MLVKLMKTRHDWLRKTGSLSATAALYPSVGQSANAADIVVDPKPLFPISPLLYMQFMEPLGVTDSSVEASWDYRGDAWRKDFVELDDRSYNTYTI